MFGGLLKIGVYGLWRGLSHIKAIEFIDEAAVIAICDKDPKRVEEAKKFCSSSVKVCSDFDELLEAGIDLVVLCNYLPDHAACAIRALHKGIAVVSECLAAATMKECVELVEAVEETGVYYSMAENSPYGPACLEMGRVYESGILGDVIYAEAEYCHPGPPEDANRFSPDPSHWRKKLPRTYYLTHCLGPLMNMTRLMPKRVIGKVAQGISYVKRRGGKKGEAGAVMLVEMEGGVLFRVTGCNSYGPATHWFRMACANGGIETVRTSEDTVNLAINPWDLPEGAFAQGRNTYYTPEYSDVTKKAIAGGLPEEGHLRKDFGCVYNYITEVLEGKRPDMDVYRSCAQSAVGILGWQSVLNDSRQYTIPDFRDPEEREKYRNDDRSPWKDDFPITMYPLDQF